jgi:gliding motility-associated-like protein
MTMKHKLLLFLLIITFPLVAQNKSQSIGFKENKGQIIDQKGKPNTDVKYLLNSNGLNVQLKKNGFSYDVYEVKKIPITRPRKEKDLPSHAENLQKETLPDYTLEYTFHRIDIDFVNSNSKVELITEQKSKDFDNYYNVPNKPDGIIGVYQYKQITYKNIYPNIDVVFSIPTDPKKTVEYNFIIHPKGKISDIQLKFNGAETDLVDNKIQMNVSFGKMEETLPASWIEDGNSKKTVKVDYIKIKKDVYGFTSSSGVSGKTVIIDPAPVRLWGTYYGEGDSNDFADIDTDSNGNIYFTGYTTSISSIYATAGTHQTSVGDASTMQSDIIIAKFDKLGKRIWGTFYGGESWDLVHGLKIDKQNNIVIVGETSSTRNIATSNSFKPNLSNNSTDAFVAKFNSSGIRVWGTYFGKEGIDVAADVDVDSNNNIYVVGNTNSSSGISINNNFQTLLNQVGGISNSSPDGFMVKFNPNGNAIWSTYIGGEYLDYILTIKVTSNYLVLGGKTMSSNYISTPGTFQETPYESGFVFTGTVYKFTLDGNRNWSTYYGSRNRVETIEVDDENNVYIGGQLSGSENNDNIASPGSFDDYNKWTETGFLAKLDNNGQRIWGTYLGIGSIIYSIISKNNYLYIGGMGGDISITSPCAYKRNGFAEGYIGKFSKSGQLIFGTYVNGFDQYSKNKICFENNNIIIGGQTSQDDRITDSNSYQQNIIGRKNFYLMKFSEENTCNIDASPSSNSPICIGGILSFNANAGYNYAWTGPNNFTSNLQNPTITNVSGINNGTYHLTASDNCGCEKTYDIQVIIGDVQAPVPDIINLPTITGDCNTTINTIPTATDVCAGSIIATTINTLSYSLPGTYTIVWNYNDGNGNHSSQEQTVIITSQPLPVAETPQTFCIQQNATLANIAINGQNIKWYDAATAGALLPNTTVLQNNTLYYATQTINGCESDRVPVTVNIQNTFSPTGNANQPFCSGQNPTIANIEVTGSLLKWYDASSNGSLLAETTNLQDGKTYYVSQTINNCEGPRFGVTVSIVNTPSVPTANSTQSFCKSENATLNEIQISGQNIKWYDTNFAAAVLPNTTLLENNKTYYASQTIGCEGDRTPILVHVYDTAVPNGNSNQQFCIDENATIADIAITGTALKWYDAAVNGNSLSETTVLQNGTYYVTQTLDNCESKRLAISVKIQDTQNPLAQTPQAFCVQENASISDIKISGENIKWFESNSSNITLSESTPLQNRVTYYASQTINNCESDRIPVTIYILEATTADCINFVDELPFPKFFTPNNDGYNDTWTIDFAYLAPGTGIKIFDRYGKFIKELYNNAAWEGNYLGKQEPASDYWFTVTRLNGTEYRGHFSLKR